MKKEILIMPKWAFRLLILLIVIQPLVVLTSAGISYESKKSTAEVEQHEGMYVFMFSKPVTEYEYLGTVKKKGLVMSGSPKEMFSIILRRAKKDYPKADAVIFKTVDMDEADCIKFK